MTHGHLANYYVNPDCGHNVQLDNTDGLINIIFNDIFYSDPELAA